ncbi:MAG: LytTR family DNA-binding domain-containing protein [Cyclobacteriaceae bacterium]
MDILIIEDEQLAADKLESLLKKMGREITVVGKLRSVESGVEWLTNNEHPDLLISDIRLLDGVSFEIFSQIDYKKPVIFTTADDQYAIQAFEVNSIDYLLKPVKAESLEAAFEKLDTFLGSPETQKMPDYQQLLQLMMEGQKSYKSRFMIRVGQKIMAVPVEKIAYFYSQNKLSYAVTFDGKKYPLDETLETISPQLDPQKFIRANRQYIISFESISEIHPYFKGRVKLELAPENEHEIVISSDKTPEFKKWLDQ